MRVAVVTPFVGEAQGVVDRCIASVAAQDAPGIELAHVFVSDGAPLPHLPRRAGPVEVHGLALPARSADGGSTPRAVGSVWATGGWGAKALAYLDVDNTFTPEHVATMVDAASDRFDVVSAARWLCHLDTGERMRVDVEDSTGDGFTDPSCIFLANQGIVLGRLWGLPDPKGEYVHNTMQDRLFWNGVRKRTQPERRTRSEVATVEYRTPWLVHYPARGTIEPPARVKVHVRLEDGTMRASWVEVLGREREDAWTVRLVGGSQPSVPPVTG